MDRISMSLDEIIKQDKSVHQNKKKPNMKNNHNNGNFNYKKTGSKQSNSTKRQGQHIQHTRGPSTKEKKLARGKNGGRVQKRSKDSQFQQNLNLTRNIKTQNLLEPANLLISNLDIQVNELDLIELFQEFSSTNSLESCTLFHDQAGNSLGTAEIQFQYTNDAMKAMNMYNGVPLDGQPMKIEILTSQSQSLFTKPKLVPLRKPKNFKGPLQKNKPQNKAEKHQPKVQHSKKTTNVKKRTASELDAEIDVYMKNAQ